ncbi:MAG TPA: ATPase [Acidobacteria bacterium]|nr:ATPase [Acidobacteriota bacterium]
MIQSVTIENFKSFERATLPLAPLTLLIGANASGKSNAIEAMQLLAWLGSGRPVTDLLYATREQELSLRGGSKDFARENGEISLSCEAAAGPDEPPRSICVSLASGFTFVTEIEADDPLAEDLRRILFLEAEPRRMREYSFVQEKDLKRDGSALSAVLHRLTEEEGQKARILEIIRSLPEQDISDITYIRTQRDEVMVRLHETFGQRNVPRDAALLSDGTLRVLAMAAALFSVPQGSLVVIEEIDNGVHPSRAGHLLSQMQKVAMERGLRVLLTTHNPALLDALPLDAIPDTVACYRDPEKGDSRLVRLADLEGYPELVAQGPIGHLLTRGILDKYLKSPDLRDRSRKVARDLAWIEEFRRQA